MTINILDAAREVQRVYLIEHGTIEEYAGFKRSEIKAEIQQRLEQLRRETPAPEEGPWEKEWPQRVVEQWFFLMRDVRRIGRHEPGLLEWAQGIERECKQTLDATNDSQEN